MATITLDKSAAYRSISLPGDIILERGKSVEVTNEQASHVKKELKNLIENGSLPHLKAEHVTFGTSK